MDLSHFFLKVAVIIILMLSVNTPVFLKRENKLLWISLLKRRTELIRSDSKDIYNV